MRLAMTFWGLGIAVLASGAWLVQGGRLPAWDSLGLTWAATWRVDSLDLWVEGVTWLGSLLTLVPLVTLAAWHLGRTGRGREAGFVLSALTGAAVLSHLVKNLVARPRPGLYDSWVGIPMDWSFPSAHSMQVAAVAMALWFVYVRRWAWRSAVAWGLAGVVAMVGMSRIYLQVHYPSDVLVGIGAAVLWVIGLHALAFRRSRECNEC